MTDIGIWFAELIKPILALLKIDGVGPFLALGIVILGIVIAVLYIYHFIGFIKEIKKAIKAVGKPSDEEFAEKFDAIDSYFSSPKGLGQCWAAFTKSIIPNDKSHQDGQQGLIESTSRAGDFFDAQSAGFTAPNLRIWPNIFVGIGLVLTFAGLIAALTTAVDGMNGETDVMQRSLIDLLQTTSAKFYTSLMALGVSIILTLLFKVFEVRRDNLLNTLANRIEQGITHVSVEKVAYRQLAEMKEQTLQLKHFSTDLAMKLGDHIKGAVSEAMTPMVKELSNMSENMGQNNLDAMREIGEAIAKNVQGAAGDSLGHLSDRLDVLTTVLGDMAANLTKSTGQFESDIAASLSSMKAGMESLIAELHTNTDKTSDMLNEKLGHLADSLTSAAGAIKGNLEQGSKEVSNELENAISKLTDATDSSASKMADAADGIKEAAHSISSTLADASDGAGKQARAQMEAAGTAAAKEFGDAGKSMAKALEEHIENLSGAINGFEKSLGDASNNLNSMTLELKTTSASLGNASANIDSSTQSIGKASSSIEGIIKPALNAAEAISSSVSDMKESLSTSTASIGQSIIKLEKEMKSNGEAWEKHSKEFDGVNERLGEVFITVNDQIKVSQGKMAEFVTALDETFTKALTQLADAVDELAEAQKDGRKQ